MIKKILEEKMEKAQPHTKMGQSISSKKKESGLTTRTARHIMTVGMVFSDMMAILLAGVIAVVFRRLLLGTLPSAVLGWIPLLMVVFVIVYAVRGFYPGIGLGLVEELRLLTTTTSLVFLSVGAATYMGGVQLDFSRLTFLIAWVMSLVAVPAGRVFTRHILTRLKLWGEPVAVIGEKEDAARVADQFLLQPKVGLKPVFVGSSLEEYLQECISPRYCPRTGVILYRQLDELNEIRAIYKDTFERVILFSSEDEGLHLNGIGVRLFGDQLVFQITQTLLDPTSQLIKRMIDGVLSLMGLMALLPFLTVIALLIKLDSKGPIFYKQRRIGKNGRPFNMVKFRTMHKDADAVLGSFLDGNPEAKEEWDTYQKLIDDPRITRVGKFIRRFSIDELPQLWNVLVGEMSVVGPRPFMVNQYQIYGDKVQHYQRVLPGITGLWQISGRNKTTFERRAELDERYVMSWSVWLDIYILIRTIWVVLIQDGAN